MMAAPLAAQPAGATPAPGSGCTTSASPGAVITQYPATPGSMSALKVACTFRNDTGNAMVSAKYTIHDFDIARWHNGAARTVSGSTTSGSPTITFANCVGITGWVNHVITSANTSIAARTFVKSISPTCVATLNKNATATGATTFKIDNSIARSVTDGVLGATVTITSATANFTAADVGLEITGTNIVPGTTIAVINSATSVDLSAAPSAPGSSQVLTIGAEVDNTTTRTVNDASTSATQITSNVAKFSLADDVGLPVYGPGIPAGSYITTVNGLGTKATVNTTMTVQAGPISVTIGDPSATAPTSGAGVANQSVQIDLNPGLVAGSNNCALNDPEGFAVAGKWQNPGSFVTGGLTLDQPAATSAIGEIVYDTSAADWAGYVVQRGFAAPGDPQGNPHYDVVFPFVPTGLGMCPGNASSPGLGFSFAVGGTTVSQSALPAGTGKPGTAQVRNTTGFTTFPTNSFAYVDSQDIANPFTPITDFRRLCIVSADVVSFQCGSG